MPWRGRRRGGFIVFDYNRIQMNSHIRRGSDGSRSGFAIIRRPVGLGFRRSGRWGGSGAVENEGAARFAPGSSQWVAALQSTDADAARLDRLDVSSLSNEVAARLWARVAAWVEADQIAYYIDDAPVSSDAAYDARLRCLQRLEAEFPSLDSPQSPTHRVGGTFSNDFASVRHPSRMMSLDDVFSIEELRDWYDSVLRDLDWPEGKPLPMTCEVKIDGLALNLIYRNGVLEQG